MNVKPYINFMQISGGFKNIIHRIKNLFDVWRISTINQFIINKNSNDKGPTTLLRATRAPVNHYFILRIFIDFFKYIFKKYIKIQKKNLNIIMLKCTSKKSQYMSLKNIFKLCF